MSHPTRLVSALVLACALAVPAAAPAAERTSKQQLYVSLGDSYASGYQATGLRQGRNTRKGFAHQLPGLAKRRGYDLQLVNFGCGGATTTSLLRRASCPDRARALDGPSYGGRTQLAAAERFIRRNRDQVALITVSIGGNDVTSCASTPDPVPCVGRAVEGIKRNVTAAVVRLRRAAGPRARIVGITYPDVILGRYLTGQQADQDLARLSVVAFRSLINPALKASYARGRGRFVDVTAATGAYGPFEQTVDLPPYGTIPLPVARVCQLTWFCQYGDIHARSNGYRLIADLIARTLPRRS
jgi:lysophospholipase L1-like esterase